MSGMILKEAVKTVIVATFTSSNKKTGDMVQITSLLKDVLPTEAVKSGEDREICFECVHRKAKSCYVNVGQAPQAIYKAYKKGNYPGFDVDVLKGALKWKAVRFGAYGEPTMLPLSMVSVISKFSKGWTGYTHRWAECDQGYSRYFMASAETKQEARDAHMMGWRTFRVTSKLDDLMENEIICPNVTTGVQCRDCLLCGGSEKKGKSIVVPVHGTVGKINNFKKIEVQSEA